MSKKKNSEDFYMDSENEQISMIAEISTEVEDEATLKMEYDKEVPVLPLRNMVMFPHVVMPITIGRASSLKLVNTAFLNRRHHPLEIRLCTYDAVQMYLRTCRLHDGSRITARHLEHT